MQKKTTLLYIANLFRYTLQPACYDKLWKKILYHPFSFSLGEFQNQVVNNVFNKESPSENEYFT